ncbi:hypothetical protein PF003_g35001 [Phytophthora fragariae]|nr:hypothetical protein PF003_g41054 [Phytophthora fragariae]KAE8880737.1 hypothetical protein PF003_g35001 [Phytophthora fragariae]
MSGGGCCSLLLFRGLVIFLCGVWIIREDVGGWSPCCLGLVGHLQHLTLIGR